MSLSTSIRVLTANSSSSRHYRWAQSSYVPARPPPTAGHLSLRSTAEHGGGQNVTPTEQRRILIDPKFEKALALMRTVHVYVNQTPIVDPTPYVYLPVGWDYESSASPLEIRHGNRVGAIVPAGTEFLRYIPTTNGYSFVVTLDGGTWGWTFRIERRAVSRHSHCKTGVTHELAAAGHSDMESTRRYLRLKKRARSRKGESVFWVETR
jgi:hypothetical protein